MKPQKTGIFTDILRLAPYFAMAIIILITQISTRTLIDNSTEEIASINQRYLLVLAEALSKMMTVEKLKQFQTAEDVQKIEYRAFKNYLAYFAEKYGVTYAYYLKKTEDGEHYYYIIDNTLDPDDWDSPEKIYELDEVARKAFSGMPYVTELGEYNPLWDGLIYAFFPIFDSDGSFYCAAGIDADDTFFISRFNRTRLLTVIMMMALAGGVGIGILNMLLYRRQALQNAEASMAKSQFLASMSHEIRTPMNAVVGMSELILREKLSTEAREYAQGIRQAGGNLLSIINDILDFSKIEAGKLELVESPYLLASLVNDVVNIIRMRIMEKPVRFFTNIDGSLPNSLLGDEARMRQILLNLLGNAVKYTRKGFIGLTITADEKTGSKDRLWAAGETVRLKITVSDSGIGIKEEDQEKLFAEFTQLDLVRHKNVEGTGLGLAIVRRLCTAMGGSISVSSVYGHGSSFTAVTPQLAVSGSLFAGVQSPADKKTLIYEGRSVYSRSICWSLSNLNVPFALAKTREEFAAALSREKWSYIFCGYGLYKSIQSLLQKMEEKPVAALMIEQRMEAGIPGARFISIPVQTLSIANVLNDIPDTRNYFEDGNLAMIKFSAPRVRVLVVDDLAANLKVAEGLMAPYGMIVDLCMSGAEAIELVKRRQYDLIFMDHMMPEMNGIEAAAIIRAWETESVMELDSEGPHHIPIVVLTANAVSGMRELFLSKGFDDYLAKPIELGKLDAVLSKWIKPEKKEKPAPPQNTHHEAMPVIPGLDTIRGLHMTGGTVEGFRQVLSLFYRETLERIALFRQGVAPSADAPGLPLDQFIILVHSIKGVAAAVGATEESAAAARLEAAGRNGNMDEIRETLPGFCVRLEELIEHIRSALNFTDEELEADTGTQDADKDMLPMLRDLREALKKRASGDIDWFLRELAESAQSRRAKNALKAISALASAGDFDSAGESTGKLIAGLES